MVLMMDVEDILARGTVANAGGALHFSFDLGVVCTFCLWRRI